MDKGRGGGGWGGEGAPFNGLNKEALSIRCTFFRLQLYKLKVILQGTICDSDS